ncbi:bifunctional sulfur transferase/dioxygenase Blh [Rhizobium sp. LjRoot258]|uniref:bifunctional sulfur transferase/dioxygenase Blh n=1 Tax=Rhizobium sp. LjRoot258 TaxID=3342299 RepID=UPI003ED0FA12
MRTIRISDALIIADQPTETDIINLRDQDFDTLINLRPDDEEADQPGSRVERAAAELAGLHYSFIPVSVASITEADVEAFGKALEQTHGGVLAHCKTGTRAAILYVLSKALKEEMTDREITEFGQSIGMDLSPASKWLARQHDRKPVVKGFFDQRTWSVQYVVSDPQTRKCVIIDPVLDFNEESGATSTEHALEILSYIEANGLSVQWILDTHPHADHFSAAHYLAGRTGAPTAIGEKVVDVQRLWKDIYNVPDFPADGSQWSKLFADGETFSVGNIPGKVIFSPGHTLASVTYVIGDAAFVHDTMFMPDSGTARADFPGGDAHLLWRSMQTILGLPEQTRVFTGHDYQPDGRAPRWESTVGEQRALNPHLAGMTEERFAEVRQKRDLTLPMPKLILPSLQVNIRGGRLPEPEANGTRYLKIPLDVLEGAAW